MAAQEPQQLSSCCVSGHIHEGDPQGSFTTIAGLRTYISNKNSDGKINGKEKTVVFMSDIFGVDLANVKILADEWAKNGFYVYVPDFFQGDPVSNEYLKDITPNLRDQASATLIDKATSTARSGAALGPWLVSHREAVSKPLVDAFLKAVREDRETGKIAAVGFCWGGRYAVLSGHKDALTKVDCVIAYHPSFLSVPSELEPLITPTIILVGTKDAMMTDSQIEEAQKKLPEILGAEDGVVKVYDDAVHGFAIRGDDMNEKEKKQKEEVAEEGMKFFARVCGA